VNLQYLRLVLPDIAALFKTIDLLPNITNRDAWSYGFIAWITATKAHQMTNRQAKTSGSHKRDWIKP
jgi:hypothetical protein